MDKEAKRLLKVVGFSLIAGYCILKPNLDYIIGEDSFWSRMIEPLVLPLTNTKYNGQPEKEWQYLLERNRQEGKNETLATIIRFLP